MNFDVEKTRIFECVTGSRLYGTYTPESDYDYRGVCIPPMEILLHPFMNFDQKDSGFEEEDRAIYSLPKFFKICADSNPNIIELLFISESNIILSTPIWEKILENKNLFISKKSKFTFTGYGFSQLNAIKRHRQWFIDPPKAKPHRSDFRLTDSPKISFALIKAMGTLNKNLLKDEFVDEYNREKEYRETKENWDHYQEWMKNRNPKRRELEESYGYDCKHASHLFRLLTEGEELLKTGKITFPLSNAEELLAIKNGLYTYDEVIEKAEEFEKNFNVWYDESELQFGANIPELTKLYFECIGM
ncbi:MAG TPA: hypothetical protein DC057_00130 [Spirochaetia bacterium]|nr:hypothetical protein [Spirochaetia bacterium]